MVRTFGTFNPQLAEQRKNEIDRLLAVVEHAVRQLKNKVPDIGAIEDRFDKALEEIQEAAGDVQSVVDERTDSEVSG